MNDETITAPLLASGIALGARLVGWSAAFAPGLSLIVDEEGEAGTPLLRVLAGECAPEAGAVRWRGADVRALADRAQVFWRDPRAPWPDISPEQWARELAGRYPAWDARDWQAHVQGLRCEEHLRKEMFRLSTGSRRKVLLAAALASGAPLTLIDEPEAALDWPSIRYLREALSREAGRGAPARRVWVVAHYEPLPDVPWGQVIRL